MTLDNISPKLVLSWENISVTYSIITSHVNGEDQEFGTCSNQILLQAGVQDDALPDSAELSWIHMILEAAANLCNES